MEYEKRKIVAFDENVITLIDSMGPEIAKILKDMESVKEDIQKINSLRRWTK